MRRPVVSVVIALTLVATACGGEEAAESPEAVPPAGDEAPLFPERTTAAELPQPRTEVAGARWGRFIATVGGLVADGGGAALSRVDLYDLRADRWSRGPDLPIAIHHTAVVVFADRLWVIGGYTADAGNLFTPVARVFSLGAGERVWREEAPLPEPRGALAGAVDGNRIVVAGGVGPGGVLRSTVVFEAGAGAWRPGPEMASAREHFGMAAAGGAVYAIGGRVGGLETNMTSVEVLRDGAWKPAGVLRHSRGGTAASAVDGVPCVAGGEEPGGTIPSVECLIEGSWQVVAELATPRHGLAVVGAGNRLHVIGGGPQPGLSVSGAHEVFVF